jgi:hypothetical protein
MTARELSLKPRSMLKRRLIGEAQTEITRYLSKETESPEFIHRLVRLFDGPQQRKSTDPEMPPLLPHIALRILAKLGQRRFSRGRNGRRRRAAIAECGPA